MSETRTSGEGTLNADEAVKTHELNVDEKIKLIENATHIEELIEEVLPKIGTVSGPEDDYSQHELKEIIHKVYKGVFPDSMIPRTLGLRSKVLALMKRDGKEVFAFHDSEEQEEPEDVKDDKKEDDKDLQDDAETVKKQPDKKEGGEKKEKETSFKEIREKYREYREKVKEAESKFLEASIAYEEERKKAGIMRKMMSGGVLEEKKKEMLSAQDEYDALLDGLRKERQKRMISFVEKITKKGESKLEKASKYIARHEVILEKHIDNEVDLLESLRHKESDKPETKYKFLQAVKNGWNVYRKMPFKTRLAVGVGIGATLGAVSAASAAGGVAAAVAGGAVGGGRRFFGMLTGTVTALETKRAGDFAVEKYTKHKLKKEHKEFAKKSLGQSRKDRLKIKKKEKVGKVASTVAAGVAAYVAGSEVSNAVGDSISSAESLESLKSLEIKDLLAKLGIDNESNISPDESVDDSIFFDSEHPEVLPKDVDDSLYFDPDNPEVLPKDVDDSLYFDADTSLDAEHDVNVAESVPDEPVPEVLGEKVKFEGVYESGSSVETELQEFLKNNNWVREVYPNLSEEQIGKIAHRLQIKITENPEMARDLNLHDIENKLVFKGEKYSTDIDKTLLENEINSVINVGHPEVREIVPNNDIDDSLFFDPDNPEVLPKGVDDSLYFDPDNPDIKEGVSGNSLDNQENMAVEHSSLEEDLKKADDMFKENKVDYLGLETRPSVESFFAEEGVFDKVMSGKKHVVLSNWGPISHARMQDVFDGEGSISYTIGDGAEIKMGLEVEQLTRSFVTQLEKGLSGKISNIDSLVENAKSDNITVGEFVNKLHSELEKEQATSSVPVHETSDVTDVDTPKTDGLKNSTQSVEKANDNVVLEKQPLDNYVEPKLEASGTSGEYSASLKPVEISKEIEDIVKIKYLEKHPEWTEGTAKALYESAKHSDFRSAVETQLVDIGIDLRGDADIPANKINIDWSMFENMTPIEALKQLEQHEKMIEILKSKMAPEPTGGFIGKIFGFKK